MKKSDLSSHSSSTGHVMASSDWLDTHFLALQPEYEAMLRWMGIQPGWHVLDAACGGGSFLPLMTELVGDDGSVNAIDIDPENVQMVNDRAESSQWPVPVTARVGSILDLPYKDNSFDAVWCANTSQYLSDDELNVAFTEFARVTRPGGLVAIKEVDLTALQFQPAPPLLIPHVYEALCQTGYLYFCQLLRTSQPPQFLRRSKLNDLRQKQFITERSHPLDAYMTENLSVLLRFINNFVEKVAIPDDEADWLRKQANTGFSEHVFHDPDFHFRGIQSVFVGRVPE